MQKIKLQHFGIGILLLGWTLAVCTTEGQTIEKPIKKIKTFELYKGFGK